MKVIVICVLAFLCGCVSSQLAERRASTAREKESLQQMRENTSDPATLEEIDKRLAVVEAKEAEQAVQAAAERVESVKGFSGKAGSFLSLPEPVLALIGLPGATGIARVIGGGLSAIAGKVG